MTTEGWDSRRVFVTGATGVVGSWLVKELLERGAYVVALVRDWDPQSELMRSGAIHRTSVVQGALEDLATLRRAIEDHAVDTVFHLGAQTSVESGVRNPWSTFEANVRGSYNLLEACRFDADLMKRVIVASSDKAYGTSEILPYTEEMPLLGRAPYDVSKSCVDLIAQAYHRTYDLPVLIARCGNIYGGGDLNWSRVVPGTIRSLLRGQRPIIRSDGRYVRDYIYVRDIVAAFLHLADGADDPQLHGQAFNFGIERPIEVLEIVAKIRSLLGRDDLEPIVLDQARTEIRVQYLSSEKAARLLGWRPIHSLEEGLRETIGWYTRFLGHEGEVLSTSR